MKFLQPEVYTSPTIEIKEKTLTQLVDFSVSEKWTGMLMSHCPCVFHSSVGDCLLIQNK